MAEIEVVEVTAPIELKIVGDRLHATVTSGNHKRTYALSFHKARNAAQAAGTLLDDAAKKADNVRPLRKPRGRGATA